MASLCIQRRFLQRDVTTTPFIGGLFAGLALLWEKQVRSVFCLPFVPPVPNSPVCCLVFSCSFLFFFIVAHKQSRRVELMLYCMPRFLEGVWKYYEKRNYVSALRRPSIVCPHCCISSIWFLSFFLLRCSSSDRIYVLCFLFSDVAQRASNTARLVCLRWRGVC